MINKSFLSTLTILYVENDEQERDKFKLVFENLFKKVLIAFDGLDAMSKFNDALSNNLNIDIVISEITLPYISGIDLLIHVKKINENIPFIIINNTTKTEELIKCIKNGVNNYLIKPIDEIEIVAEIQKNCLKNKKEDSNSNCINELEEYLNSINKVAIVSIFDDKGKILYVNSFFSEVSKYLEEDLLEQDYTFTYHNDISKSILQKQWDELQDKKVWKGKVKHIAKNHSIFYTNTTITSVLNKNKSKKFISINFLTTEEENKKRDYKKKVLYNLQETKKVYKVAQDKILQLKEEISKYENDDKYEEELIKQKELSTKYYEEIKKLEYKISNLESKERQLALSINNKIHKISNMTKEKMNYEFKIRNKIKQIEEEIKVRESLIVKISNEITKKSLIIDNKNRVKV